MQDKIENLGKSIVHHGKINDRIYLMKLHPENLEETLEKINELAISEGYSKIFGKIQVSALPDFLLNNYSIEAFIPKFYQNKHDCVFVSKFMNPNREKVPEKDLEIFYDLLNSSGKSKKIKSEHSPKFIPERLNPEDVDSITEVFRCVFESYPFPVHNPDYILQTMQERKTQYFGIKDCNKLIGISTAEIDFENKNAEMTDFAVLPEYRGQNIAFLLLAKMEEEMKFANIKTVYTIARLKEPGMNKTFIKSDYKYTGTLINNTNISGSIESMNIYYKHI